MTSEYEAIRDHYDHDAVVRERAAEMSEHEQLESAERHYRELIEEASNLRTEQADLKQRLSEVESRLHELHGAWSRSGQIKTVKDRIAQLKRSIQDGKCQRVVWDDGTPNDNHIVSRVTPKRIFVRQIGATRERQYVKATGKPVSEYPKRGLNLEAMGMK